MAVDLFATSSGSQGAAPPYDEKHHLDTLYNHLVAIRRHPFLIPPPEGISTSDAGLRKILRTRVPILGNGPLLESEGVRRIPCVVMTYDPTSQGDMRASETEAKDAVTRAGIPPSQAVVSTSGDGGKVTITFDTESTAVRFLCKCERAAVLNKTFPPAVYCTRWDMSARLYGVRNSQLLRRYLEEPHHRIAAAAVKIWSKKIRINDPRVGLLSSYSIALMFVYYLVQKGRVAFIEPETIDLAQAAALPRYIESPDLDTNEKKSQMALKVGQAFVGFITFYCFEFNWDTDIISLLQPGVVSKKQRGWTEANSIRVDRGNSVRYHLGVEDPYEKADPTPWGESQSGMLNVTRKITEFRCLEIHQKFIKTFNNLGDTTKAADKIF
eukprot:TRINITY_DN11718_c1_g2_i3.p2 TRINITY_DN11718_c1_g2~~TRINITY_DN11718_c1_g2_i3.p2  ORF type:complete len:382 (+),score=114.43 TRINITY_DN11718_c1_g2_i3:409-1554(+)